jgi:hypothetical protein
MDPSFLFGAAVIAVWLYLCTVRQGKDIAAAIGFISTGYRVLALLACIPLAGVLCGAIHRYQMRGTLETHTTDDYRFEFVSDRDFDYEGQVRDSASVSVYHRGKFVAGSKFIGSFTGHVITAKYAVRRIPQESLIIATDRRCDTAVVFAYDIASGECYPSYGEQTRDLRDLFQARIRKSLGDSRYSWAGLFR